MGAAGAKSRDENAAIASWCAARGFTVRVVEPVGQGALNRHWRLALVDSEEPLVFRARDEGHWLTAGFVGEARAMTLARRAGLPVPEVLQAGQEALLMRFVSGTADREQVIAAAASMPFTDALVQALKTLQQQTRTPVAPLRDAPSWLKSIIASYCLAHTPWFAQLAPAVGAQARAVMAAAEALGFDDLCLAHGDFRTGNFLVETGALQAVIDWEFAGYRPVEADVGWMLSSPWRYSRPERAASGLLSREALLDGLEMADTARVRAWEALALVRWAVIAGLQDHRQGLPPGSNADQGALLAEAEALVKRGMLNG